MAEVLRKVLYEAREGVTTAELDQLAEKLIIQNGAECSFKKVKDYKWTICASVNDVVVHGIPSDYRLKAGDILGIDCGVYLNGFHTDCAWSIIIGNKGTYPENKFLLGENSNLAGNEKFLAIGRKAWFEAIKMVKKGNYIYDISRAIQSNVEKGGYSVVYSLVGHGVGKELHEAPEVPGYINKDRKRTPLITKGMVLAIEVIYNLGGPDVVYNRNDGWTIAAKDGTISGLFEATVAVTSHGSYVLTPIVEGMKI